MNEIIQRLIERTGLPEAQAAAAAEVVIGFLKEKLPPAIGSQIDGLVSGEPVLMLSAAGGFSAQ